MTKTRFYAYLSWISICIVWGTTYLAIRIGVDSLPPMLFAGIRWVIAGFILLTFLRVKGLQFPEQKNIFPIALVGILLIGVANGLVVVAEQWIPSGLTSLLITTMPFWIVGFELIITKEKKVNKSIIFGLLIGFSGVVLIFWNDLENIVNAQYVFGILAILGAVISWSVGSLYSKYKTISTNALMSAAIQMIIAGVFQLFIGVLLGEVSLFSINTSGILAIAYLVIFGSLLGYALYIYSLSVLPVSFVATYTYINPIIAIFLGWLVLDEKVSLTMIISAVIIILGVALVQYGNFSKKNKKVIPS